MKTEDIRIFSVVVVDDSKEYRVSLLDLLARIPGIHVSAEGANEKDAVRLCVLHEPDILLMDSSMPAYGALTVTKTVRERTPATYIVLMTTHDVADVAVLKGITQADRIISKSDIKSAMFLILSDLNRDTADRAN